MTSNGDTRSRTDVRDSPDAVVAGRDVIGISFAEHTAELKARVAEVRRDMERAHEAELATLRQQLAEYERRLANPEASYKELVQRITELEKLVDGQAGHGIGENRLASAKAALERGDFSEADGIFADVRAKAAEDYAEAAYGQGLIAEERVQWAEAAEHFSAAARTAPTLDRLLRAGEFLWRMGRHREAMRLQEDALARACAEHGEGSSEAATVLNDLALSHMELGEYDKAEPLFRRAIEIDETTLGPEHPNLAIWLNNLAKLLAQTGRAEEAQPMYARAMAIIRSRMGDAHPSTRKVAGNYARLLAEHGAGAKDAAALAELKAAFGPDIADPDA